PSSACAPKDSTPRYGRRLLRCEISIQPMSQLGQKLRLRAPPDRRPISAAPRKRTPMLRQTPVSPPRTQVRFLPPTPIAAARIFIAPPPSEHRPSSASVL